MLDRFRSALAWVATKAFPNAPWPLAFGERLASLNNDVPRPMEMNAAVYAAVSVRARNVASPPVQVYSGTREDRTPVDRHPLQAVLDRPNALQSKFDFWEVTEQSLSLCGEAYWLMPERPAWSVYPGEIISVNPSTMSLRKNSREEVVGWTYRNGSKSWDMEFWQVLQFRYPHPRDPWRGLAPLTAGALGLRSDRGAQLWNEAFFRNGASNGQVIHVNRPLGDKEYDSLKRRYEADWTGAQNAHKFRLLEGAVKIENIEASHTDMAFLEQRRFTIDEVLMLLGCPIEVVGLGKRTFENVDQAWRGFWRNTLRPEMDRLSEAVYWHIHTPVDGGRYFTDFDTDGVQELQQDLTERLEQGAKFLSLGYTPNQINERLDLGMPEVEWGNEPVFPFSGQDQIEGQEPEGDTEPLEDEEEPEELAERTANTLRLVATVQSEQRTAAARARLAFMEPSVVKYEKQFRARVRLHFSKLRAEMLRRLGTKTRAPGDAADFDVDDVLFDMEAADKQLRKLLGQAYQRIMLYGAETVARELGVRVDVPGEVLKAIRRRTQEIVGINETFAKQLRGTIANVLSDEGTIGAVAEAIRDRSNKASTRALMIARTEVNNSINEARQDTLDAAGIKKQEWVTAGDEHVRESHEGVDGEIAKLGEQFGNGLRFPGDPNGPPEEVINCRCRTVAVIPDEED